MLKYFDSALINITIRTIDNVRSMKLIRVLNSILNKMKNSFSNKIYNFVVEKGLKLVSNLRFLAQKWGNNSAKKWIGEISFAKLLAVIQINSRNLN